MALPFLFADNARSTLAGAIGPSATSLTVAPGDGAKFPSPAAGQQFALTLNDNATGLIYEVVYVTSRSGDVMTIVRAQEGTTAKSWNIGDKCWNGPTSGQMAAMVQTVHMTDGTISPIFAAAQINGNLFVGGVTTHVGNVSNQATTFFGTSGAFYMQQTSGSLLNFAANNYLWYQAPNILLNAGSGSLIMSAAGNASLTVAGTFAITAPSGASTSANFTAFGALRAATGYNAGDLNRAVIGGNYSGRSLATPGYAVRPDGLMFQWNTQVLNGDDSVFEPFPVAFPNACIGLVCTEGAAGGGWGPGTSPTIHGASGFTNTGWFHGGCGWDTGTKTWHFSNLTTNWMAVGF